MSALAGAVLIEAFWESRKKDMIDLIAPFVQYGVASNTTVGGLVDVEAVTNIIRREFGYTDIPISVVIKVLNRDKEHFDKRKREYYLIKPLDEQFERFERRKQDCLCKIETVGQSLYEYLYNHCRRTKIKSKEQCVDYLQAFFSKFAVQVGLDTIEDEDISVKYDEINYHIAQYIFEKKSSNSVEYAIILDLTKGFFLKSAIYLQVDNTNINTASYKNVNIYYDTPILLQILGYQSEKEEKSACLLHTLLKKLGARFYYFEQNDQEIVSILTAYQYSLTGEQQSSRTLEGLDEKRYTFDSVTRLKKNFSTTLRDSYDIYLCRMPEYAVKNNGAIDIDKVDISERDAIEYVRTHTKHYSEDNLKSDVSSAIGIHRIREGVITRDIEQCKALFVTSNVDFTKAFNDYYRELFGGNRVMPVITSFDLSAIAWVKGGDVNSDIPESQLLTNAYIAMQPAPEIMEKCRIVLTQLEREGDISKEDAISLRTDRVTQRELWIEYFPDVENIDENYIEKLQNKQKERLTRETEQSVSERYEHKIEEQKKHDAKQMSRDYARKSRERFIKTVKASVTGALVLFAVIGIYGLQISLVGIPLSVGTLFFAVLSILGIIDTLTGKGKVIQKWIEKKANHHETIVYEKKLAEYMKILDK